MRFDFIVFEGHDGSGKTTIAKELAKMIGYKYFKNHSPSIHFKDKNSREWWKHEFEYLLQLVDQKIIRDVVFDRHIPSEWVYSEVFGRETDEQYIFHADYLMAEKKFCMIICEKENVRKDDALIPEKNGEEIKKCFRRYRAFTKMETFHLYTDDENLEQQIKEIMEFIR